MAVNDSKFYLDYLNKLVNKLFCFEIETNPEAQNLNY